MEFYSYFSKAFVKVCVYNYLDGTHSFRLAAYHCKTKILSTALGTSIDDPYSIFTASDEFGKFTRSDINVITTAIHFALKHSPSSEITARLKAVKEVVKFINYGKFDNEDSFEASNGVNIEVGVYGVTEVSKGKPTGTYLAINDID